VYASVFVYTNMAKQMTDDEAWFWY